MITNEKTNTIVFSDLFPKKFGRLHSDIVSILDTCSISNDIVHYTNDIWVRDYFPIQIEHNKFVSYKYYPDYLRNKFNHLITEKIEYNLFSDVVEIDLIIDGGNVEKFHSGIIMTDKVFKENSTLSKRTIQKRLESAFESDVYFFPKEPYDPIGHIDGLARVVGDILFVNDYTDDIYFRMKLDKCIDKLVSTGHISEVVYVPYKPDSALWSAVGNYINFIHFNNNIIIPQFKLESDIAVYELFKSKLSNHTIFRVECSALAQHGGVLNCVTSNIFKC